MIDRINFDRGRILPRSQVNASLGADIYKSERITCASRRMETT